MKKFGFVSFFVFTSDAFAYGSSICINRRLLCNLLFTTIVLNVQLK